MMNISQEQRKELLKKYSQDSNLDAINMLSEEKKSELLLALGGEEMLKKKHTFLRNIKVVKYLCQTKLQMLLSIEKQSNNPIEKVDTSDYKTRYATNKEKYINMLYLGFQSGDILPSKHVFDHVISDGSKYKSGSFTEKMKYSRGLTPYFLPKNWQEEKSIHKKYLSLDPEKIECSIIDFLKTGEVQKNKYTPAEELVLKQRFLNNHNDCKEILLGYEALVIPNNEGYSQENTERIVKLKKEDKPIGYLVSENTPIRYTENHLRKYRGNEFSFEIFATKETLVAYLKNQLFFMKKQRERFQEIIIYFTALDRHAKNKENIKNAYLGFSTHGTFTDQVVTEKLKELLSDEKRGRKQIIDSIIEQAKKGIKETEIKENIMWEHYNAIIYNNLF